MVGPPLSHLHLKMYQNSQQCMLQSISLFWQTFALKVIVSRDFKVCFLVPLDSSDIATPSGTGSIKKKSQFRVKFLIFWALALVVFTVSESQLSERPGLIS
jgi:hypothetical protein